MPTWLGKLFLSKPSDLSFSFLGPHRCHHLAAMSDGTENDTKVADQVDGGDGQATKQKRFMQQTDYENCEVSPRALD
jgi:hypothetical protein